MKDNRIVKIISKIIHRIPFGIISILFAALEWLGFAFAFMIIPALFAWFFWFWAIVFGIIGIVFKKRISSIIGIVLSQIPIINIVIHFIINLIIH